MDLRLGCTCSSQGPITLHAVGLQQHACSQLQELVRTLHCNNLGMDAACLIGLRCWLQQPHMLRALQGSSSSHPDPPYQCSGKQQPQSQVSNTLQGRTPFCQGWCTTQPN